jgi:hypothetical protein
VSTDDVKTRFARKYGIVKWLPPEERAALLAICKRDGHVPELTAGEDVSKFVSSIVCRCSRCHETVETSISQIEEN